MSAEGAAHDVEAVEMGTAALGRLITRTIHAGREGSTSKEAASASTYRAGTDWIRSGKGCSQIVDVALGRQCPKQLR